jgi:threonine dehydrogenase-like Zn-dependent dehydrogenase
MTQGRGADAVVVATSSQHAIGLALRLVRPGGRVLLFGSTRGPDFVSVDAADVCVREIDLIGSYGSDPRQLDETVSLLLESGSDWSKLVTHVLPLEAVNSALDLAVNPRDGSLKVLIAP